MSMKSIVQVDNLTKKFKNLTAVNQLSFSVQEGDVYGFLGQNGAGKSTSIRMMLTLIEPTAGSINIFGMDLAKHRKEVLQNIGAVIENQTSINTSLHTITYNSLRNSAVSNPTVNN